MPRSSMRSSWIWVVLAAALIALSGAPTAATAQQTNPVEITFWNYWDGQNGKVMQSLVDRFNSEQSTVKVKNVFIGFNDLLPKLQAAAAGGDTPDLAAGDLIWMPKLASSGAVVPVKDYADAAGIEMGAFYPAQLSAGTFNGESYAVPVSTNNLELFINRDLFKAAGLDPNAPPKTWEELRATASKCANADKGVAGMELFTEPGEGLTWQFQVYLWQAQGEFLNQDGTSAAFNSAAGKQALQFWVDLLNDKSATAAPWGAFGQGKACMAMDGSWMVGGMAANPPFDFGTAAMPIPTGGVAATNMGGEQLVVFKTDDAHQQAAATFAAWLTKLDVQREWVEQTGFMPVQPALADDAAYLDWVNKNEPQLLPFVQGQKDARNRPAIVNYPEVSDAFSRQIEPALLGAASVPDALSAAEKDVNGILAGS